jgi:hypothetical protein
VRGGWRPHLRGMHPPVFVREPSAAERARLEADLRAPGAFAVRRARIVPLSAAGRNERRGAQAARDRAGLVPRGADRARRSPRPQPRRPRRVDRRLVAPQERRPGAGRGGPRWSGCAPSCIRALIWDNASRPISREVRAWSKAHNRRVKAVGGGRRLLVCRPPRRGPWLNPIEPEWVHGRRAVVEPERELTGGRTHAAALRPLPLPAPPAPRTAGLLNMH